MYIEKMVLALLQTSVNDIMGNKDLAKCSDRRDLVLKTLEYFHKTFSVPMDRMKDMVIETIK